MNQTFINHLFQLLRELIPTVCNPGSPVAMRFGDTIDIAEAGWDRANFLANRYAERFIWFAVAYLGTIFSLALLDQRTLIAWLAVAFFASSLLGLMLYIVRLRDALLLPALSFFDLGKRLLTKAWMWVATAYAISLGASIYLALVPITNSWLLTPVIILSVGAAGFFHTIRKPGMVTGMVVIAILFTVILCFGGPGKINAKFQNIGRVEPIVLRPDSTGSLTRRMDPGTKWTAVAVHPGYWTETLAAPPDATGFYAQPDGNVGVQKYFPTGWAAPQEDGPLHRSTDRDLPTGMRWYNPGSTPVIIRIQFQ